MTFFLLLLLLLFLLFLYFAVFFICTATWSKRKTFSFLRFWSCATERKNEQNFLSFFLEHVSMPFRYVFNRFVCYVYVFIFLIFIPSHFVISFHSIRVCSGSVFILFSNKKIAFIVQKMFQCPSSIEWTTTVMIIIINDLPTSRWINTENWLSLNEENANAIWVSNLIHWCECRLIHIFRCRLANCSHPIVNNLSHSHSACCMLIPSTDHDWTNAISKLNIEKHCMKKFHFPYSIFQCYVTMHAFW